MLFKIVATSKLSLSVIEILADRRQDQFALVWEISNKSFFMRSFL